MQENRRFCLQVFSGDTVENVFSDVATSKKTWQRYRKFLTNPNLQYLLHRLLSFFFLLRQGVQNLKKIINRLNFLAIHVTELQLLLSIKPIIQTYKLYTLTDIGIFIKPPVFGGDLIFRLNKNLNLTLCKLYFCAPADKIRKRPTRVYTQYYKQLLKRKPTKF